MGEFNCRNSILDFVATMKVAILIPLLAAYVSASPALDAQTVLGGITKQSSGNLFGLDGVLHGADKIFDKVHDKVEQWAHEGKEFVKQNGLTCEWERVQKTSSLLTNFH